MDPLRRFAPLAIALLAFAPIAAACSSDAQDEAADTAEEVQDDVAEQTEDAGDEIEETADEAAARAAAEDLRARIKANDTANDEGVRSTSAIEESMADVAGDPEFEGLEDTDGDGLDDDGEVQVNVGDASACLTLPESGEDMTVEGGAC